MSLRLRLTLLLAGLGISTAIAAWAVAAKAIRPFALEVWDAYLEEVAFVAKLIDEGAEPAAVGAELGLELSRHAEPPVSLGARECQRSAVRGRDIVFCGGPRPPVGVKLADGWLHAYRELDVGRPGKVMGRFLLGLVALTLLAALWMASVAVRPLRAAREGMARIAAGELGHRLEERGPAELVEAARSFNGMAERVAQMLATERSLMAGISHELRTPLARLRLETELLADAGASADRTAAMNGDLEEIDRLIGELLELSRLSIGERTLAREPVDLLDVAREAERRVGGERVEVEGSGGALTGDRERLVRVVTNLLANALKYAPTGPIRVRVDGGSLAVEDEGPGVPPEALPRLFEPFYRANDAPKGLGLGLMIAKQVVALHGGEIGAENRPGGGLVVRLSLPL